MDDYTKTRGAVLKKYGATSATKWSLDIFVYGQCITHYDNLTYADCKRIYLREEINNNQAVVIYANGVRLIIQDKWLAFWDKQKYAKFLH